MDNTTHRIPVLNFCLWGVTFKVIVTQAGTDYREVSQATANVFCGSATDAIVQARNVIHEVNADLHKRNEGITGGVHTVSTALIGLAVIAEIHAIDGTIKS